jgi:hypothetical protein
MIVAGDLGSRPAFIGKAEMTCLTEDKMIQQPDAQQFPGFAQSFGQQPILLTRRRVSRGMIMATQPGRRVHHDQGLEDFPRMDDRERQRADRHHIDADHTMFGIQAADDEVFPIQSLKAGSEHRHGRARILYEFGQRGSLRLTDERHSIPRSSIRLRCPDGVRWLTGRYCESRWFLHPSSSFKDMPHPAQHTGVGQKEEEGTALSQWAGLDVERSGQTDFGRPDPLLPSDGPPPLGAPSSNHAGGDADASWGTGGVVRLPRFEMESKKRRLVRRTMNNGGVRFLIRTDRNGSLGTRRVKLVDPHARFEDLDL